jgi:hypothetical protein
MPIISRFAANTHRIRRGSPYQEYYYYRFKASKGQIKRSEIERRRTYYLDCDLPLYYRCFY